MVPAHRCDQWAHGCVCGWAASCGGSARSAASGWGQGGCPLTWRWQPAVHCRRPRGQPRGARGPRGSVACLLVWAFHQQVVVAVHLTAWWTMLARWVVQLPALQAQRRAAAWLCSEASESVAAVPLMGSRALWGTSAVSSSQAVGGCVMYPRGDRRGLCPRRVLHAGRRVLWWVCGWRTGVAARYLRYQVVRGPGGLLWAVRLCGD